MGNETRKRARPEPPHGEDAGGQHDIATQLAEVRERQRELEDRLRASEAALKQHVGLLEDAPIAHLVLARDGTITQANRACRCLLEVGGKIDGTQRLDDFVDTESRPVFEAFLNRGYTGHASASCELALQPTPEGLRKIVQIQGQVDAPGRMLNVVIIDITAHKTVEAAAQRNLDLPTNLSTHIPGVLFQYRLDPDGSTYFPFISEAIHRMYGLTRAQAHENASRLEVRVHPEDRAGLEESMHRSATTLKQWCHEYRMRLPDGKIVWRSLDAHPEKLADGSVLWHGYTSDITERKQMEDALRTSEEPWKLALEGAGDGVWDWDVSNNKVTYSSRWKEMLGYTAEDVTSLPDEWHAQVHPDDIQLMEDNRRRLLDGTTMLTAIEVRMLSRNGHWKWILSRGIVVTRDALGIPLRVVGTNTDITERKQMEESLRENEERWKLALEGAGHGVWDWDLQTNRALFSKRWKEILGYAEDEIGSDASEWMSRTHPDDQPIIDASYRAIVAQQKNSDSIEFRMRRKDGRWIWVLGSGILTTRNDAGKTMRMVGTLSDISERKRVEEALRSSEERWKFALEGAGDGVWDWNVPRGEITFSRRAREIMGHDEEEVPKNYDEWCARIHPDDMAHSLDNREKLMAQAKDTSSNEVRVRCKDGRWKWLLSRGMVVSRDTEGKALRLVGTISDISQRKQTEEALRLTLLELEERRREAERLATAKSRFLNAASHDLRQPLYATRLFADALADENLTGKQRQIAENLALSVKAMSAQLETLLDVSRLDMGKLEPQPRDISLASICHDLDATYGPIARQAGVTLRFLPGTASVHTDAVLIGRLLGNLIDNAIKFAARGSVVVCARRSPGGIRIEVRDNGPGIAPEHRQQIFDEYYQVANPARNPNAGLGLGLSIVQRIAQLLGAPLVLKTNVGRGTVFAVTLPAAARPHRATNDA